jgi:hypothetical protein
MYKNRVMKAKFLSIILIPVLTIGCEEEDKLASIEGSWRGTKAEGEVVIYGVPSGFEEQDESFDPILEFKTDGTVKITDDGTPAEGTWSQTGNILTTAVTFNTEFIDLSGDYTIESLTDTKLVLYYEKDGTYSDPDTGIEIEGTLKATLYFDKK